MRIDLLDHWIAVTVVFIAAAIIIVSIISFFVRKYIHSNILKKHHELAGFVITTLGVLYAVFLGVTATNAQKQYNEIDSKVNREAYLIADLVRFTNNLAEPAKDEIHENIRIYLKSIIDDEWKLLGEKKESPRTLAKLKNLWDSIYAYKITSNQDGYWFSQCLAVLSDFNNARLERIYTSWETLGTLAWLNLIFGAITLVCLLLFFGTENARAQTALNGLFVGILAFMMISVFLLNRPFNPPNPLTPKAYIMVYDHQFQL